MNIAIITNLNGIGLQRDYELLREYLQELGHAITGVQFDAPIDVKFLRDSQGFDLAIFLEVTPRDKFDVAPRRWLFANPEWIKPDQVPVINKFFQKVFAKTREGERVLTKLFGERVHYVGFLTRDQYDPEIERKPWFLHIGGNSSLRGTQAVVDAWRWKENDKGMNRHLIVISKALKDRPQIPMVTYHEEVDEEELKSYQNECKFHIYPSGTEGFGHALHEALSVDATILTTAGAPMDEIESAFQLEPYTTTSYNYATVFEVSAIEIHRSVKDLLRLHDMGIGNPYRPREEFLRNNADFRENFKKHFDDFWRDGKPNIVRKKGQREIIFLGNFRNEESTENMVKWALEKLGHAVWPMQEDEVTRIETLEENADGADLFLWVHTRGWLKIPDETMTRFLREANERNEVRTASLHLDKFWGIPDREKLIGVHPFWKCGWVFTADGSNQDKFLERNVNHCWMQPAVSEVYCHPGVKRSEYLCDVGFVGARDYHAEYPFRRELVDFLEDEYRGRFRHITDLRGHRLNDFYASCKVVVGDCIFAGTPNYWSDRVPETCGRDGFLLHPKVVGLTIPVPTYLAQSLSSVKLQIEHWLKDPENLRDAFRGLGRTQTWAHHTWTVRMWNILREIFEYGDKDVHENGVQQSGDVGPAV